MSVGDVEIELRDWNSVFFITSGGVRVGRMVSGSLGGHGSTGMEGGRGCEASAWV